MAIFTCVVKLDFPLDQYDWDVFRSSADNYAGVVHKMQVFSFKANYRILTDVHGLVNDDLSLIAYA